MATAIRNIAFKTPATTYELAALLIKSAFHFPGGLKPDVLLNLQRAHDALLKQTGPDLSIASLAAGAALSACMVNRILDDRPETGVVYTVANLLANAQSGRT
jgi:hypothetical protein